MVSIKASFTDFLDSFLLYLDHLIHVLSKRKTLKEMFYREMAANEKRKTANEFINCKNKAR